MIDIPVPHTTPHFPISWTCPWYWLVHNWNSPLASSLEFIRRGAEMLLTRSVVLLWAQKIIPIMSRMRAYTLLIKKRAGRGSMALMEFCWLGDGRGYALLYWIDARNSYAFCFNGIHCGHHFVTQISISLLEWWQRVYVCQYACISWAHTLHQRAWLFQWISLWLLIGPIFKPLLRPCIC